MTSITILWSAINAYVRACGGEPDRLSVEKTMAADAIESALEALIATSKPASIERDSVPSIPPANPKECFAKTREHLNEANRILGKLPTKRPI